MELDDASDSEPVKWLSTILRHTELPDFPIGLVWLIGAGPGDPGLVTLHGLNALLRADAVVYDALLNPAILEWCRKDAEIIFAGKRGGRPSPTQGNISEKLIELSRNGKRVARLKGGDPFVFGRGGEEALALVRAGIPIRITPGITAGIGGLAYAGIPATHRDTNQSVTFLTGHDQSGDAPSEIDWSSISAGSQSIVLYMARKHLEKIVRNLLDYGRSPDEPAAVVSNASLPDQHTIETTIGSLVSDVAGLKPETPSIICIGRNVLLRQAIDWFGQLRGDEIRSLHPLEGNE